MPELVLNKLGPTGDGSLLYPSGTTAVVVCKDAVGHTVTVYSESGKVLAVFDTKGVGGTCYKSGRPCLVTTLKGWSLSDENGDIIERGRWPRTGPAVVCKPSKHITVTFKDRRDILVKFSCDSDEHEWQCGEQLRRSESHLDKVVGSTDGKLELDIGRIRRRQADVGSVYVAKGPHSSVTPQTGLATLKQSLAELSRTSTNAALIRSINTLHESDQRVKLIDTLPGKHQGQRAGVHSASTSPYTTLSAPHATLPASPPQQQQHQQQPASVLGLAGTEAQEQGQTLPLSSLRRTLSSSPLLPDYGSPPLSEGQRRWQARLAAKDPGRTRHTPQRLKLETISMSGVQRDVFGTGAKKDHLYVLCLLATWNPVCARREAALQSGNWLLHSQAQADPAGPVARVKVLHVDASEGRVLQEKYGIRSIPYFIMIYEGRTVQLTNNISTGQELHAASLAAIGKGRRGNFLPDSYKVSGGTDNQLLDSISPSMSLRY